MTQQKLKTIVNPDTVHAKSLLHTVIPLADRTFQVVSGTSHKVYIVIPIEGEKGATCNCGWGSHKVDGFQMDLSAIRKCVRCKRTIKINARGRCSACYNYLMRNGVERPIKETAKEDRFCVDCKEEPVYCMDRCKACYDYHLRYKGKKTRPAHLRNRNKLNCKNPACEKPLRLDILPIKGYCKQCYDYFRKRGVDRPAVLTKLILPPGYTTCSNPNCDRPLMRPEFCGGCLGWFNEYRELRPRKLCSKRVDLGWCECGEIATTECNLTVEKSEYTLILCDNCLEIETSLIS